MSISRSPLERLARAYGNIASRARLELSVEVGASQTRCTVTLLGLLRKEGVLVVSAPRNRDQALIAVSKGQALVCTWTSPTTSFKFRALIAQLAFEPVPLVHLNQLHSIRYRKLRGLPRALAALAASLRAPGPHAALLVDLSVSGARIGVPTMLTVGVGGTVELTLRLRMIGHDHTLVLPCQITAELGTSDPAHPQIHFYGLSFGELGEHEQLVLHAYVQERLAAEYDVLSQTLLLDAEEDQTLA